MRTYEKIFSSPAFALGFIQGIKYAGNPLLTCNDYASKKSNSEFIVEIIDHEDDEDVQDNGVTENVNVSSEDEIDSPYKPKESLSEFVMAHDLVPIAIPKPEVDEPISFGPSKDSHNRLEDNEIHLIVSELKKAREKELSEDKPTIIPSSEWKEDNKKRGSFKRITYVGNEKQKYVAIRKDNGQLIPSYSKSSNLMSNLDDYKCMNCLPCFMGGDCIEAINAALKDVHGRER